MTPDLEIRVTTEGETQLAYMLRYAEGRGKKFDRGIKGPTIYACPREYQLNVLKRLEHLGKQLGTNDQLLTLAEVDKELAAIGHDLYKELFPPELRTEYSQFRNHIRSLLIVSDEPWIPWEIVKPYSTEGDDHYDDDFLCCQFEMTRWLAKGAPLLREVAATRIAAVEAGVSLSSRKLCHAHEEVEFLQKIAERRDGVEFQALFDATYPDTMDLLERGGNGVLLFVGHGETDADDPNESRFLLNDGRSLRPRDLHGLIERTLQHDRPLVFFNSCQVAQQDFSLTRIGGWAARWVRECGCGAFVGPQWSVDDSLACLFSQSFFAALDSGETFGQAAQSARLRVRAEAQGRPSWLAYTIYAHPNGRLHLGGRSETASEHSPPRVFPTVSFHGNGASSKRCRRSSIRPVTNSRFLLVGLAFMILLAVGLQWRFGNAPNPVPSTRPPSDPAFSSPGGEDSVPATVSIDVHALQKPPFQQNAVSFYIRLPESVDPPIWRDRIESTSNKELTAVALSLTRSTSAAWLVVLEVSDPKLSQGGTGRICQVQARYEIYHERQQKVGPESMTAKASQFTDDAACQAAIHKVAERVTRKVVSAYLDQPSED